VTLSVFAEARPTGEEPSMLARVVTPERPLALLVEAAKAGDRAAYAEVYARLHRAVHGVILARARFADAQDLVQDTFVAAWTKLDDLRDPAAFPGWILEIARRRAVDHARKRQRDRSSQEDDEIAVEPTPRAEAAEALRALRALPEAYRETMVLRLVEGMTGPEIAAVTGLTPESVRVNLCRGMKLLKEQLGDER
jgi:RNA polymerase sigma-70 factor (ECF subfamily)